MDVKGSQQQPRAAMEAELAACEKCADRVVGLAADVCQTIIGLSEPATLHTEDKVPAADMMTALTRRLHVLTGRLEVACANLGKLQAATEDMPPQITR